MSAVLEFLRQYWFELAAGVGFILELVFIFVKRKPKSLDDFLVTVDEAMTLIPGCIVHVERPGEGTLKKQEVISRVLKFIEAKLSRRLTASEIDLIKDRAGTYIELILSTPKKKENENEK